MATVKKTPAAQKPAGPKKAPVVPGTYAEDVQIDPRGYRLGAGVTAVFAIAALLLVSADQLPAASIVMTAMVMMFLPGATIGPQATLQALLFKKLVAPRISKPTVVESFRPPRFAQQMGFAMAIFGAVMGFAGLAWGVYLWAGLILFASFLNSVFGFCAGCEIYLLLRRTFSAKSA